MAASFLLERLENILVYKKREQRAPHKPLYLLFCIASMQQGKPRLQGFDVIDACVGDALRLFGPRVSSVHPEYPFWRLQNDGLAIVEHDGNIEIRASNSDPTKSSLFKANAKGGLLVDDYNLLYGDLNLQSAIIHKILDSHFPTSIHEDICRFFNLKLDDPHSNSDVTEGDFRRAILDAYSGVCAVTGFSLGYNGSIVGVEAAHICWPQQGGNESISNGIAMTTLHRKLFHLGFFTIDDNYKIRVSNNLKETNLSSLRLCLLHGQQISLPANSHDYPSLENLRWHEKWVFKG